MKLKVLILVLMTSFFSTSAPVRSADIEPLLPKETEQVIYVNFKQVMDSEIFKKYLLNQMKQALEGQEVAGLLKNMGLDPMKDLETMTAGIWGSDPQNMQGLLVVHGKFDAEKIFNTAKKASENMGDKISIVEEGDYKLVKFVQENSEQNFYAAVASEKVIVAGNDKKLVATALKAAANKAKPAMNKKLMDLVLKQNGKVSMYFCGLIEGKIPENLNIPPGIPGVDGEKLSKQLRNMVDNSVVINLGKDVTMEVVMGMKDTDSADDFGTTVSDLINTAKTFLPLLAGNQPQAKPLIDDFTNSIKSSVKAKKVTISLKISADSIAKMAGGSDN